MVHLTPYRLGPDAPKFAEVLALLRASFAYMEGRIDPPTSLHRLDQGAIANQAETGEVWCIGTPPVACLFLTPHPDHLYLGKLAVTPDYRHRGFARQLVSLAGARARKRGLGKLMLKTRIELTENQCMFETLGFRLVAKVAHPGYDRPTTCIYEMDIP
jgi:ribosomal protein S18 acetylase RimI-like enzyme